MAAQVVLRGFTVAQPRAGETKNFGGGRMRLDKARRKSQRLVGNTNGKTWRAGRSSYREPCWSWSWSPSGFQFVMAHPEFRSKARRESKRRKLRLPNSCFVPGSKSALLGFSFCMPPASCGAGFSIAHSPGRGSNSFPGNQKLAVSVAPKTSGSPGWRTSRFGVKALRKSSALLAYSSFNKLRPHTASSKFFHW